MMIVGLTHLVIVARTHPPIFSRWGDMSRPYAGNARTNSGKAWGAYTCKAGDPSYSLSNENIGSISQTLGFSPSLVQKRRI